MPMPRRAALAAGLCLTGILGIVAQSPGRQARDGDVRKTAAGTAGRSVAPTSMVIGTIDMEAVLKGYEKAKAMEEKVAADIQEERKKLIQMQAEMKRLADEASRFAQNSPDAKKYIDQAMEIELKLKANEQKLKAEFAMRWADTSASLYDEIQRFTAAVAKKHGMSMILRIMPPPAQGQDPDSVMNGMQRNVVYADPSLDISNEVISYLNNKYRTDNAATGAPASSAATPPRRDPSPAPAAGSGAPNRTRPPAR